MAEDSALHNDEYVYKPLPAGRNAIRLLTILPGLDGVYTRCTLKTHIWDPDTGFVYSSDYHETAGRFEEPVALSSDDCPPSTGHDGISLRRSNNSQVQGQNVQYTALSYTWTDIGIPFDGPRILKIDGKVLKIGRNLSQAIRTYQYHANMKNHFASLEKLWIDAICINQADAVEKADQIQRMDRIYLHAASVAIWLFPSPDNSIAFQLLDSLWECLAPQQVESEERPPKIPGKLDLAAAEHLVSIEKVPAWYALLFLFYGSYWVRAWTLQEFILAKNPFFFCNRHAVSWLVVDTGFRFLEEHRGKIQDLVKKTLSERGSEVNTLLFMPNISTLNISSALALRVVRSLPESISTKYQRFYQLRIESLNLLRIIQDRSCFDPRDKIYCIRGLLPPEIVVLLPKPDCTVAFQTVFKNMTRAYILAMKNLDVICQAHYTNMQVDMPSWTPDWCREERMANLVSLDRQKLALYHRIIIESHPEIQLEFLEDDNVLAVSGRKVGRIVDIALEHKLLPQLQKKRTRINNELRGSYEKEVWEFRSDFETLLDAALELNSLDLALWEDDASVLLGMLHRRWDPEGLHHRPLTFTNLQPNPKLTMPMKFLDHGKLYESARGVTRCMTVASSDSFHLCLVPQFCLPGDLIYVLYGCTTPVVLRANSEHHYKFVGACYVSGMPAIKAADFLSDQASPPAERLHLV